MLSPQNNKHRCCGKDSLLYRFILSQGKWRLGGEDRTWSCRARSNFVYTRRKRRLLGLEDALDPNTPNSSAPSDNTKKIALPTDGWGTALAKVQYLPVRKWTDILRIQEKTLKLQGFSGWWIPSQDPDSPRSKLFYYRAKCFHRVKKLITCNV